MPNVALVPNIQAIEGPSKFTSLEGLRGCPEVWRPKPDQLNPTSFPSPLGRAEATRFLVGRGHWAHPLSRASAALLKAVVGGELLFRWLSHSDLKSPHIRGMLERSLADSWPYLGLIEDKGGQTWGYVVNALVPVLAGARDAEVQQLEERVKNKTHDREIRALLEPLKQWFEGQNAWKPDEPYPWMVLVDRVLQDVSVADPTPSSIDLRADVRSFGPFRLTSPVGDNAADFYLPAISRGFVDHLAQAVMRADLQHPEGAPYLLLKPPEPRSEVRIVHRPGEHSRLDGVVIGQAPQPPAHAVELALAERDISHRFDTHLSALRDRTPDGLTRAPFVYSDIQRVIAVHAPEMLGGQRAPLASEAFRQSKRSRRLPETIDFTQAQALVDRGHAVVLPLGNDTSAFFVEWDRDGTTRIGDLSMLGLGLWRVFTGSRFAPDGKPYLVEQRGFPIAFHGELAAWWGNGGECEATRKQLASLQRMAAAYTRPIVGEGDDWAKLAAQATRHFLARLFESEGATSQQLLGSGWPSAAATVAEKLGPMHIYRDSFRDANG